MSKQHMSDDQAGLRGLRRDATVDADRITEASDAIMRLCRDRGADKSICPSEAARAVAAHHAATSDGDAWRDLMPTVRAAAEDLVREGQIVVTQKGAIVDPATARGAIRLRLAKPAGDVG